MAANKPAQADHCRQCKKKFTKKDFVLSASHREGQLIIHRALCTDCYLVHLESKPIMVRGESL